MLCLKETNIIADINKSYMNNMKSMFNETINFYKKGKESEEWINQRKYIVANTRILMDHLIISKKTLNQIFNNSNNKKFVFSKIQEELLKELNEDLEQKCKDFIDRYKISINEINNNLLKICASKDREFNQIKIKEGINGLFLDKNNVGKIIENLKLFKDEIIGKDSFLSMSKEERNKCFCVLKENNLMTEEAYKSYNKILNRKIEEINLINKTYSILLKLRYILFDGLNEEVIFSLGFIEDKSLFDESNFLRKLVDYRTDLYKAILAEIPERLKDIFVVTIDDIHLNDDFMQNVYLYLKSNLLIKLHQEIIVDANLHLKMSEDFQNYCDKVFTISEESYVFKPDIIPRDYSNLEIFIDLLGLKEKEIAELFNMTPTKFSRQKNQKRNIDALWADRILVFYSELEDYLINKITIPKMGGFIKRKVVKQDINHPAVILTQLKYYYIKKGNNLDVMKNNINNNISLESNPYKHLIEHIEFLSNHITKLKKEDFEAIQRLLRFK